MSAAPQEGNSSFINSPAGFLLPEHAAIKIKTATTDNKFFITVCFISIVWTANIIIYFQLATSFKEKTISLSEKYKKN